MNQVIINYLADLLEEKISK